ELRHRTPIYGGPRCVSSDPGPGDAGVPLGSFSVLGSRIGPRLPSYHRPSPMSPRRACAAVLALAFVTQPGGRPATAGSVGGCTFDGTDDVECRGPPSAFGRDPFPKDPARRVRFGRPLPAPPPSRGIPPVRDLLGVSYYTD